jgi:ankyrin repeat protein
MHRFVLKGVITLETFKTCEKLSGQDLKASSSPYIHHLIRGGETKISGYLIKELWPRPHFGFNELHYLALESLKKVSEKITQFRSVSVAKKAPLGLTPLHVACVNPNAEVLKMFLDLNPDFNMTDA